LWWRIRDQLRTRIAAGEWPPGGYLPSEPDLAHEYAVGIDTIKKVTRALAAEGVILRRHAKRAQVPQVHERQLVRIPRGSTVAPRMPASDKERELWGLPLNVPLLDVTYGGRTTSYPSDRYDFTTS